jgi:hypothetical protein
VTAAVVSALVVAVVLVAGAAALVVVVRRKAATAGIEPGRPDAVSAEVVSGLMAELRKWQAETAYWKAAAERLQRELDQRS